MTTNKSLIAWLRSKILNHSLYLNVQKDKLPEFLRPLRGSILFISSRYEGFSLSLIEGMSQGLIPIAYSVGVVPEIIRNGENGFIISSQAEAIERVNQILSDEVLREKLSAEAIKTSSQLSSSVIAQKLIALYESIFQSLPVRFRDMSTFMR